MYNWSTDVRKIAQNPEKYAIWKLEQTINFGLGKEKINRELLWKHWAKLKIDPARRRFLELFIDGK